MKLLDLFCGAGGAAMGYHLAGFDAITGVDLAPQPRYPFSFVQADAMDYVLDNGEDYDLIHASPPCQGYSVMRHHPWLKDKEYPLLIDPLRDCLMEVGRPYVIENVMGAKLDANWLCGGMFDLPIYKHRFFESSFLWFAPDHPPHVHRRIALRSKEKRTLDIVHSGSLLQGYGHLTGVALVRQGMGIDWMTGAEITQAIPPAYTQYVGEQWLRYYANKCLSHL